MGGNYSTKKGWTSKKGVFLSGIWHCDCEPRLPAEKFQTKNGGKNRKFNCFEDMLRWTPSFLYSHNPYMRSLTI